MIEKLVQDFDNNVVKGMDKYVAYDLIRNIKMMSYTSQREGHENPFSLDNRFVTIKGMPLYLTLDYFDRTKYCLVPIIGDLFAVYKKYEAALSYDVDLGINFYIVERKSMRETFREYLKHDISLDMVSHHFGAKSKEVIWGLATDKQEVSDIILKTAHLSLEHNFRFYLKNEKDQTYTFKDMDLIDIWYGNQFLMDNLSIVYAKHGDKYIAAMFCIEIEDVVHCNKIAVDHSEEYKKYSLVVNAQIAAVKEIFYNNKIPGCNQIDLGLNFHEEGNYKNVFNCAKIPMKNVKSFYMNELEELIKEIK